ncbi:MAG TPA: MraY family glycosyltransferase [Planctomycetaceae bacterium]|nr:MraY family glycosyltransferase [Planctomycetaceae bacterium]
MSALLNTPWIIAPAVAVVMGALLTAWARQIAPLCGLVDKPDGGRKLHRRPTPVMGGAAFFTAILSVLCGAWALGQSWICEPATAKFVVSVFSSAALYCLLGVIDDRFALRARTKLLGQIVASLPFAVLTVPADSVQLLGCEVPLGPLAVPFTVFWLVACSNVINLIDGLDGLAGTVGVVSMLTVATLFANQGEVGPAIVTLVVAASIVGFLIHNWPPAKIFMGDGGSLTIGYLVGALSIEASSKTATGLTLGVPLVIISIPIFDTCMAIARRKLNGRGIGEGDRGHIHHRLQDQGLSRKQALLAIVGLSVVMAAAALTAEWLHNELAGLAICGTVLVALVAGRVFGHYETSLFLRHLREVGGLLLDTSGVLQTRLLLARIDAIDPRQRLEIWRTVSQRVAQMGATRLEFRGFAADGHDMGSDLLWIAPADDQIAARIDEQSAGAAWQFEYRVPRSDGQEAVLKVAGLSHSPTALNRLDGLFRLFDRVCREMPFATESAITDNEPATLPMVPAVQAPKKLRPAA